MNKPMLMDETTTKGHTCFFYEDQNDRLELLTDYFEQGIDKNELCVFVAPASVEDVKAAFAKRSRKIVAAIDDESLRIFEMSSTYLANNRFIVEYMLNNVKSFIEEAKHLGYSGLRTAGEMKWVDQHPDELESALVYEQLVNTLNTPKPSFIGLCLYPVNEVSEELASGALRSHPTLAYKGQLTANSFFGNA